MRNYALQKSSRQYLHDWRDLLCRVSTGLFGMVPLNLILFALSVPCFCQATYTIPPSKSVTIVLP